MIILETRRLLFRDHEPGDIEPFCAMEGDPLVRRYVGGEPRTREAAEKKFRDVYLPAVPDRMGMWATVFKPESQYVGYCGIYPHFNSSGAAPREGVLGFYLSSAYWGRGLATETGKAFVEFGFGELALSRIIATVDPGNVASVRVLEKLGFRWVRRDEPGSRTIDEHEIVR